MQRFFLKRRSFHSCGTILTFLIVECSCLCQTRRAGKIFCLELGRGGFSASNSSSEPFTEFIKSGGLYFPAFWEMKATYFYSGRSWEILIISQHPATKIGNLLRNLLDRSASNQPDFKKMLPPVVRLCRKCPWKEALLRMEKVSLGKPMDMWQNPNTLAFFLAAPLQRKKLRSLLRSAQGRCPCLAARSRVLLGTLGGGISCKGRFSPSQWVCPVSGSSRLRTHWRWLDAPRLKSLRRLSRRG